MPEFRKKVLLPVSKTTAFSWHERPGAFGRLSPPWEKVQVLESRGGIKDDAMVRVKFHALGPLSFTAEYKHQNYVEGERFCDVQIKGPFKSWYHEHRFTTQPSDTCEMEDVVQYEPPVFSNFLIKERLEKMFRYRHFITRHDLDYEKSNPLTKKKTVLITGASGLVGKALSSRLTTRGHEVRPLSRRRGKYRWNPSRGEITPDALKGVDCVVHLAGEPLVQMWTPKARQRIKDSRVKGTGLLCREIALTGSDATFITASGSNYYGKSREGQMDESESSGEGFLAEVCREWEGEIAKTLPAQNRRVMVRTGIVLSPAGGMLQKLLPVFNSGAGGRVGSGKQMMSWIELNDLVEVYLQAIENESIQGPINACTPNTVSNRDFTRTMGKVLNRPTVIPVPGELLTKLLGDMGEETVLSNLNLVPRKLQDAGFDWINPELEQALRFCLGR